MSTLLEFWSPVVRAFDPYRPITVGDPEHFYVERSDSPLGEIATRLRINLHNPRKIILTGHRGSGKSSELARLAAEVGTELAVVWIDAQSTFNLFDIGQTELLLSIGAAIHRDIPVSKQFDALRESLATTIEERIGKTAAALTGEALKKVGVDFRHTFIDREVRRRIEVPPVLGDIVDKLNLIISAAYQVTERPLLVIIDGLDRLDLEASRRIFVNNQLLTEPECHVIFTVPITLYSSIYRQGAREQGFMPFYLPNVKLHRRGSDEPIEDGFALMRRIVERRLALRQPDLIAGVALDHLIEMSGGVIRELITLMEKSCTKAMLAEQRYVGLDIAQAAVDEYRLEKATSLQYDYYYEEMARVHRTGELTNRREKDADGQEFVICDALVEGLYLLRYSDGAPWYDVHPIMRPLLERYSEV